MKPVFSAIVVGWILSVAGIAEDAKPADLWKLAEVAYQKDQIETGHIHLRQLINSNTGDVELAVKCLSRILQTAGKRNAQRLRYNRHLKFIRDPWAEFAARRLCALERMGAISANTDTIRHAFDVVTENDIRRGQLLDAKELVEHFIKKHPRDPYWRIAEARLHRRVDSAETRSLFAKLSAEKDVNHPDMTIRERWKAFDEETQADQKELPRAIAELPKGSPLAMMTPDDPDGEWQLVRGRSAKGIASQIDRLFSKIASSGRPVPWSDKSGLTDAWRALDLHLRSQDSADLAPLRKLQESRYARRRITEQTDPLAMFRRYPWSLGAQRALLEFGNKLLWSGHSRAALRCYEDVILHSLDEKTRARAQVGIWSARAQFLHTANVKSLLGNTDPKQQFPWVGQSTPAGEICRKLLAGKKIQAATPAPKLAGLKPRFIRTPSSPAWSGELVGGIDLAVSGNDLLISGRDMLAMYDTRNPQKPTWQQLQRHPLGDQTRRRDHPGYFRPTVVGDQLFTRWGFGSLPRGIAAIDRATGKPLWAGEGREFDAKRRRLFEVPLGDPVLADGLLYFLEWRARDNINNNRDRSLNLVCYDPRGRKRIWTGTIVKTGFAGDRVTNFSRANPASAIYGNRVTISEGAVYSGTNAGLISRSDIRDGRTEWVFAYRSVNDAQSGPSLGAAPVIVGDLVICMPRDSRKVFAIDRKTGRLVWENPFVPGVELLGKANDLLVVRTHANLVGIDIADGNARWYRPVERSTLSRAMLIDKSVYIASATRLLRVDATSGLTQESRSWQLTAERPRAFTIAGQNLFVVTDKPADPPGVQFTSPAPVTPAESSLKPAWSLSRYNAAITVPPGDSQLKGLGFVFSEGILECCNVSEKGGIRWRRFVNANNPAIHFVGKTLLLIDRATARAPGRVIAYDATIGRALWETVVGFAVHHTIACDGQQVFHDNEGRVAALDVKTGKKLWERDFGFGRSLRFSWQRGRLHAFFVARSFTPRHQVLDVANGMTLSDSTVEPPVAATGENNAKPVADGYYEVIFPPQQARYVRLIAISEVNGAGWASAAELHVIGKDGKNLSRNNWRIHKASPWEKKHKTQARPQWIFDGDRSTWWHSPWMDGIIPHPHEVQIDLGTEQNIKGLRYLPAVIINNNGMIRDYEFHVSKNGKDWKRVAKGILVQRLRVSRANLIDNAIYFETHHHRNIGPRVYRYAMNGTPATLVRKDARLLLLEEPYLVTTAKSNNEEVVVVQRTDDPNYRFELGSTRHFDNNAIHIAEGRLIMTRRSLVIADLAKKRIILGPGDQKQKYNRQGITIRAGKNHLLRIVQEGENRLLFRFDLRTGEHTQSVLDRRRDPIPAQPALLANNNGIVLLNDRNTVTAWVVR